MPVCTAAVPGACRVPWKYWALALQQGVGHENQKEPDVVGINHRPPPGA